MSARMKSMTHIGLCILALTTCVYAKDNVAIDKGKNTSATTRIILCGVQKDPVVTLDETRGLYLLTGEYVVPAECEFKICEGVRLVTKKKSSITIQGKLDIQGSKEHPVIIKSDTTGFGAWDGIKIQQSPSAEIAFAYISGAKIAVASSDSKTRIWNSTFYRNEQVADFGGRGGVTMLENCMCVDNKKGIQYTFTKVEFDSCTFEKNSDYAVCGTYYGELKFEKCIITKNGRGIQDDGYDGCIEGYNCIICDNRRYDVCNNSSIPGDFSENWWGKQMTTVLKKTGGTKMPKALGSVKLFNFLTEPPEDCGAKDCPSLNIK